MVEYVVVQAHVTITVPGAAYQKPPLEQLLVRVRSTPLPNSVPASAGFPSLVS